MSTNGSGSPLTVSSQPTKPQVVTPAVLRSVLARFATGVTVLTVGGPAMHGMTANAFSSVSLDPPLVLCCVARPAVMHGAILDTGSFCVSFLGAAQQGLARYFADRSRPLGPAQFDPVRWRPGPVSQGPLLTDALGWLECELVDAHAGGDHSVFIGRVLTAHPGAARDALLFFEGRFGVARSAYPVQVGPFSW